MKKILFIISEDWYFASHRLNLAQAAIAQGYEVAILTQPSGCRSYIEAQDIKVFDWSLNRGSLNPILELKSIWQLFKIMNQYSPDLIHAVALKPILYSSLVCKILNTEGRIFALGGLGYIFNSRKKAAKILKKLIAILLRGAFSGPGTRVIVQNSDDFKKLISLNIANNLHTRLIKGAGVDTAKFFPMPEPSGVPLIILPARLLFSKGIQDFIITARKLRLRGLTARFALIGDRDSHNPECIPISVINEWTNERLVEIWGHQKDMVSVFRQSSIVCLPSFSEGLPKALLEAASCARPIVAYDIPGCRDVVKNGYNGFLVPLGNLDALEKSLAMLITNVSLRNKMGELGRSLVIEKFSQEQIAAETIAVWMEVLN